MALNAERRKAVSAPFATAGFDPSGMQFRMNSEYNSHNFILIELYTGTGRPKRFAERLYTSGL